MPPQDPFDAYPLAPFLASLGNDFKLGLRDYRRISLALRSGGPWDLEQLRHVLVSLIARDAAQEAIFQRRFDRFFDSTLTPTDRPRTPLVQAVREAPAPPLSQDSQPQDPQQQASQRQNLPEPDPDPKRPWHRPALVAAAVLVLALWRVAQPPVKEDIPTPLPDSSLPSPSETSAPLSTSAGTLAVPVLDVEVIPSAWETYAKATAFFFLAFVGYGGYLRWRKSPQEEVDPEPDPSLPRFFDPGVIGGRPTPTLDDETLDVLADSMGYFRTQKPSRKLAVRATVEATGRNAGLPQLVFQQHRQLRRVVLLEDSEAASLVWNPIVQELATGLKQRGVPVVLGRFQGVPEVFQTEDGEQHLEDLEDDLGHLLLIFSDAKGLRRQRTNGQERWLPYRMTFNRLAHWPMVAWMEPREPRAWDRSTAVPASFGIPIFPATPDGLTRALGTFLTERAPDLDPPDTQSWQGLPPKPANAGLGVHVEQILGDALLWAQALAMMMPPVSPGLADAVRHRFHPGLPKQRLARLLALPGTTREKAGLRFSTPVLAVLRHGFTARRSPSEQEEVLRFLLEEIHKAEPKEKESAAYRAWEWRRERVHLELEPDLALQRLSTLANGALGDSIRRELAATTSNSYQDGDYQDGLPLRSLPKTRNGALRLSSLKKPEKDLPLDDGDRGVLELAALFLLFVISLAGLERAWNMEPEIDLESLPKDAYIQVFFSQDSISPAKWESLQAVSWKGTPKGIEKVAVIQDGRPSQIKIPADRQSYAIRRDIEARSCRESIPGIPLEIVRCGDVAPRLSWRQSLNAVDSTLVRDRVLSVGLEYHADVGLERSDSCEQLADTGSVDICFIIEHDEDPEATEKAVARIRDELEPWFPNAQLIWWLVRGEDLVERSPVYALIHSFKTQVMTSITRGSATTSKAMYDQLRPTMSTLLDGRIIARDGPRDSQVLFFPASVPELTIPPVDLPSTDARNALITLDAQIQAGVGTDEILKNLRKHPNPFDILGVGVQGIRDGERVLRVVELLLMLLDEEPEDHVRIASMLWALDFAPARDLKLAGQAQDLRNLVLQELRRRYPVPSLRNENWTQVPAGSFLMGSSLDEGGDDERPQHRVDLPSFFISRYEVTNGEIRRLLPNHAPQQNGDLPATDISWYTAYTYAAWLGGRLPTEAEWEYAARAGCAYTYCLEDGTEGRVTDIAWIALNSNGSVQPVIQLAPNPWGLYDTLGNVSEWVADSLARYSESARTAPWTPSLGLRGVRGGNFRSWEYLANPARRSEYPPESVSETRGFRIVIPAPSASAR